MCRNERKHQLTAGHNCDEIRHDGFFTWHRVYQNTNVKRRNEHSETMNIVNDCVNIVNAKKNHGALALHGRGIKPKKSQKQRRNGSNKMESLTGALEMRRR